MGIWDFSQNGHFDSCLAAQFLSAFVLFEKQHLYSKSWGCHWLCLNCGAPFASVCHPKARPYASPANQAGLTVAMISSCGSKALSWCKAMWYRTYTCHKGACFCAMQRPSSAHGKFSTGYRLLLCKSGVGIPMCAWGVLVSLVRKCHSNCLHSTAQGCAEVPSVMTIHCHLLQGSPCKLARAFLQDTALCLARSGQRGWPWCGCLLILTFLDEVGGSCVE